MQQREHRFQAFTDRFIDRVVLPPFFTSGTDAASQTTDNARTRAAGRGIKFGLPDIYVVQGSPTVSIWIELKLGYNKATERQEGIMRALGRCGVHTAVAYDIHAVHAALREAGFRLHGNAANIAAEVTARWQAADASAEIPKPKRASKPRQPRPTATQLRFARKVWGIP